MARSSQPTSWIKPSVILPAVLLFLAAIFLLTPHSSSGDKRLTSYSANKSGVKGLYDVLEALRYPVERRLTPMLDSMSTNVIYVLLSTPVPLSDTELNQLLSGVRNGAGLIFAWEPRLTDSLGFSLKNSFALASDLTQTQAAGGNADVPIDDHSIFPFPITTTVSLRPKDSLNQRRARRTDASPVFLWSTPFRRNLGNVRFTQQDSTRYPAIVKGTTFGAGRVVIISDPEILRNVFAKDGRPIFAIARAIDWINEPYTTPRPVVFDEYHQGFGMHANVLLAIRDALIQTPIGRTTIQLCIAAFILLLALGARALVSTDQTVITRRSPIEHVGALAHAYEQTNAKHLATDRLLHGLRRRIPLGTPRSVPHTVYLDRLAAHLSTASSDINILRRFLGPTAKDITHDSGEKASNAINKNTLPPDAPIASVGAAIARIEALSKQHAARIL